MSVEGIGPGFASVVALSCLDVGVQLRVDSRWHPSRAAIQALVCPIATPATLGVRGYTGSAPLMLVAGQNNEMSLYDLQDFRTRLRICCWLPRRPADTVLPAEGLAADDIADVNAAQLPAQSREGFRAMLPLPSGGLICAGAAG